MDRDAAAPDGLLMLSLRSETMPVTTVDDYGDLFLAQQISQVSGVAQVSIFGDTTPSIRIQIDPAKLASTGITLEEIRSTLVASTTNAAKGTINTDKIGFTIAANDQILDAAQFNDVILAYRNGAPIRLSEIANVVDDVENQLGANYYKNEKSIRARGLQAGRRQHGQDRRRNQ